jgi:hypothetical protein
MAHNSSRRANTLLWTAQILLALLFLFAGTMIGATTLTVVSMGALPALLPFVVGVIAAAVAYGSWRAAPIAERRPSRALRAA